MVTGNFPSRRFPNLVILFNFKEHPWIKYSFCSVFPQHQVFPLIFNGAVLSSPEVIEEVQSSFSVSWLCIILARIFLPRIARNIQTMQDAPCSSRKRGNRPHLSVYDSVHFCGQAGLVMTHHRLDYITSSTSYTQLREGNGLKLQ
jgi:hypothetical protein